MSEQEIRVMALEMVTRLIEARVEDLDCDLMGWVRETAAYIRGGPEPE